jgi:hypothetical protein
VIPALLTPINPVSGVPSVGIAAANISGNAPQVPAAISALPPTSLLQGFVLNRDSAGNPILRTELGDFLLQSNLFLKIGSSVLVRVDATGQNFRANIIEVDGTPVNLDTPNPSTATMQKTDDDQIVRSSWIPAAGNASASSEATTLNAVLLTPNAAASAQQLKEGSSLIVRLFNLQLPSSASLSATSSASATTTNNTATTSQTTSSNISSTNPTAGNVALNEAPAQAVQANAYQSYASSKPSNAPATTIQANTESTNVTAQQIPKQAMLLTVIGQERDGDPVLQTPFGLIKITSGASIATGTQIQATLALANTKGGTNILQSGVDAETTLITLAQKWPALTQILSILTEANNGELPAELSKLLPQIHTTQGQIQLASNNVGAGLFGFLAALQRGDARSVLGERNIRLLEKLGHSALVSKLDGDMQILTKLTADIPPQGWQSTFLPVLVNGQVEMTRWFTKRDGEKDKDGKKREDSMTRFIVEVTMSQLGDLQLDGLFKQHDGTKQFELIIRSHQPLEVAIQQDIQQIYQDAQNATGVSGGIIFQASEQFPVQPLEEVLSDPPDVFA